VARFEPTGPGKMRFALRCACVSCIFLAVSCLLTAQRYPAVASTHRTFAVPNVKTDGVSLSIRSQKGVPLYLLKCHSADYGGDPGFDYSGDFECRLSLIGQPNTYSTLLTEDVHQSRDWESRGRFFAADLRGRCANIPDFRAVRHFRLRGMDLTLRILNPMFTASGELKSLRLAVTVNPDQSADRSIAEIVPLPKASPAGCKLGEYFVSSSAYSRD